MQIPTWLLLVTDWISALTIIFVFGGSCIKPVRNFYISIYQRIIKEPDETNKQNIEIIKDRVDNLETSVQKKSDGTRAVLSHLIYKSAQEYIHNDEISVHELEDLETLLKPYKKLGGNGTAKKLYEDCKKLKIRKE